MIIKSETSGLPASKEFAEIATAVALDNVALLNLITPAPGSAIEVVVEYANLMPAYEAADAFAESRAFAADTAALVFESSAAAAESAASPADVAASEADAAASAAEAAASAEAVTASEMSWYLTASAGLEGAPRLTIL